MSVRGTGNYHGRASVTTALPHIFTWHAGDHVYLEGLRVRVIRVTSRPITDEEMEEWPDSDPDDRMVDVEFVEASV